MAHWAKVLADKTVITRTIIFNELVAGNIGSFGRAGERLVGYWIGRPFWGRGIATLALAEFLGEDRSRPLHAHVAQHNVASIRVLEKCGFTKTGEDIAHDGPGGEEVAEIVMTIR